MYLFFEKIGVDTQLLFGENQAIESNELEIG